MTNRLSIIDSLEAARKAQGLTQEDLAERAGTSRVTVGRVESGFDPKLATVYELARALGLELMVVPKVLAREVQAFIQSGGRVLGQPSGAGAPDSVVATALAISQSTRKLTHELHNERPSAHSARSLAQQFSGGTRPPPQGTYWSARSVAEDGMSLPRPGTSYPPMPSMATPSSHGTPPSAKDGSKAPTISAAALARLHGITSPKGGSK